MIDGAQGLSRSSSLSISVSLSLPPFPNKLPNSIFLQAEESKPLITPDTKYATCQARLFFLPGYGNWVCLGWKTSFAYAGEGSGSH